ncbi:MAG: hypothetical protein IRY99_26680 [Isosphaeraceae bacterium]|nr:hypothetical protein [Isosphaeraceae bacterium]
MDWQEKRLLREHKRLVKRAGGKHRRQQLKRSLREHPEEAPYDQEDFGRYRSADLNGLDRDATRRPRLAR